MKKILLKLLPLKLIEMIRVRNSKFYLKSTNEVFTQIFNENHWKSDESISGGGSEKMQTNILVESLNVLFKNYNIKKVLDIPSGDFNWMQNVNLSDIDYIGADIVVDLIKSNSIKYKSRKNIKFQVLNLLSDQLPKSDLIIVRDCLVHLSYKDIQSAISNIKSSGSKFLLTTTFTNHSNFNISTGEWRPINLQEKPFYFRHPLLIINENCSEGNGEFIDKSMALWEIDKL